MAAGGEPGPRAVHSPLSGGGRVEHLRAIPSQRLVEGWRDTFGIDVRAELPAGDVDLYRCLDTGLEFYRPIEAEGSGAPYADLQERDWYYAPERKIGAGSTSPRWEHRRALRDLAGARQVVEVGSGRGDFLRLAARHGRRVRGLELNEAAVAAGRQRGLDVVAADVARYAADHPASCDAVCSFQTLEHIAEPMPFLSAMVRLLRPGGRLIVAVPNGDAYLRHLPSNWLDMPPHHMLRWNESSLRALTGLLPLELISLATEPLAPYNVNGWVSAARHRLRQRRPPLVAKTLLNRHASRLVRGALRAGLRRWVTGHSIYAGYRRRTDPGSRERA